MKKRMVAMMLCLCMVACLLPTTVLAAGEQTELDVSQESIMIGNGTVSGKNAAGEDVTIPDPDGYIIIGTTTANTVTISGGMHNITLSGVSIDVSETSNCAFSIYSGAMVNLTLAGSNILSSGANNAGLQAPEEATLTINGQSDGTGSLTATGGKYGAGIGGGTNGNCGTVIISGGTVTAIGDIGFVTVSDNATGGAGIGGGYRGNGGTVEISGGTVTAAGGMGGAGIGGSYRSDAGIVNISGGTVTATSQYGAAGIGGGYRGSSGTVEIDGGMVLATGGGKASGIGGGAKGAGGSVNISGGTVTATGGEEAAGIGGGYFGDGGTVIISGGNVKATGLLGGANIGAGLNGNDGTLTNGATHVYLTTLTLTDAAANTPIDSLNAEGISYTYGMTDVKTLGTNKLYLYLPVETTVNSVTTGETPTRLFTNQSGTDITVAGNHDNSGTLTEVKTYILTVNLNGGNGSDASGDYTAGEVVTIDAGTRANYSFNGWTSSNGGTFANSNIASTTFEMPANATTIAANWINNDSGGPTNYTLTFDTNGGTPVPTISRSAGSLIQLTQTTSKTGYTFDGWYTDEDLTNKVTSVTLNRSMTVYAKWTATDAPEMFRTDHVAYIIGYPDGNVHPEANITRSETATIFFRLLTDASRSNYWKTTNSFFDVSSDTWFNNAVSTMANAGFIKGYTDGTFGGDNSITRAEFAVIAARANGADGEYTGTDKFTDISGHWAAGFINEAVKMGLIEGYPDGTFMPDSYITRAEAMTLVNRFLGRDKLDPTSLISGMNTWSDVTASGWYYYAVQEATNSHEYTRQSNNVETWTEIVAGPDWAALEKSWSTVNSAK